MDISSKTIVVPLYVCDEHNEAFYCWHKAKYDGYIHEAVDLLHVDAHNDMGVPSVLRKSIYFPYSLKDGYLKYYDDLAQNELKIYNFVLPSVLSGMVQHIYFVYPKWRRFKPTHKKMVIYSVFGDGKIIRCNAKLEENSNLCLASKVLPDLKHFNYYSYGIEKIPKNRKVILDIDLDYFACRDSISNNICFELEITKQQFLNNDTILKNKTLQFSGLDFRFRERNKKYYVKIGRRKVSDVSYLPSKDTIESEINTVVSTLQIKKIVPVIITICRSCVSGYCPRDYYEFVENRLKRRLRESFSLKIVEV